MEKTTNPSFLLGKIWYWRDGHSQGPILSCGHETKELCLPILKREEGLLVAQELAQHGIHVSMKRVHNGFACFPEDTLIVYANRDLYEPSLGEEHNLDRLQKYIQTSGGQIFEPQTPKSLFSIFKLFTKEK